MSREERIVRALEAAKGRIELLASIIDDAGIEHNSDHPCATGHVLKWIDEALAD